LDSIKRVLAGKATKAPMSPSLPPNEMLFKPPPKDCSKEIKKELWFREVSKLPPCLKRSEAAETSSSYQTKEKKSNNR